MKSMNTSKISIYNLAMFAHLLMGRLSNEAKVEWAENMIIEGLETPSLLILAGLFKPLNSFEVDGYLEKSLKELELEVPNREICLRQYINYLADMIIQKQNDLIELGRQIYTVVVALDYPIDLIYWMYINDCLKPRTGEPLFGEDLEKLILEEAKKSIEINKEYFKRNE
jgi:hypothetical protein